MGRWAAGLGAAVLAQALCSGDGEGARTALREALRTDALAGSSSDAGGGWDLTWPPTWRITKRPTAPTVPPTPAPTPEPAMQQLGPGGCKSELLDGRYVFGTLEVVKALCLADARCKVVVYHATGSGLHAFCERDKRFADVWLKLEGPRAGLDLCKNLGGCTWSGGPCETGPGACDAKTGRCSAAGRVTDGTACDDGNSFTSDDRCSSGLCAGHERDCLRAPCPASTACVSRRCVNPEAFFEKSFCVSSINNGAKCDDGNAATLDDTCDRQGTCVAGKVGNMTLASFYRCGSTADAACKAYGTRYDGLAGCFSACGADPDCRFVQTQVGSGGDCSLFKKCCSASTARIGQVYQKAA